MNGSGSVSRWRSLTQEDLEQEAAHTAFRAKVRHVKQRRKRPIQLSDDEDIEQGREQYGDVDVEAGGLSSSVSSLCDRQKMK